MDKGDLDYIAQINAWIVEMDKQIEIVQLNIAGKQSEVQRIEKTLELEKQILDLSKTQLSIAIERGEAARAELKKYIESTL
jgi:hypothetical protein